MSIYITGSVAYDRIMTFAGKFTDHIIPEKIHSLNVSFLTERMEEKLGGCSGNIAYSLSLLGEHPVIVANVGQDFERYRQELVKRGVSLDALTVLDDEFTAGCYILSDQTANQITAFNPGAMRYPSHYTFPSLDASVDFGIVAPTNVQDMLHHTRIHKEHGVRCIFDPGQQIPALSKDHLIQCISGSFMLICNEYELEMIMKTTGMSHEELRSLVTWLIVTLGAEGSRVEDAESQVHIDAVPALQVVDPTGAGDAYRSGLLKGLVDGLSVVESARYGATAASFCVEKYGTQEHHFTMEQFLSRHKKQFGV